MGGAKAVLAAVVSCGLRGGVLCFRKVDWLWIERLREMFGGELTDYNQKRRGNGVCFAKDEVVGGACWW